MQPVRSSRILLYSFLYSPACQKNVFQCVLDYFMLQNRFNLGMFFWTRYGFLTRFNWIYKKSEDRFLWFFLHKLKIVFLSKLWNKKWGSPCSLVLQSWRCSQRAHHLLSTFPFLSEDWGEFLWNTRWDSRPSIKRAWKESAKEQHLWYFIVNKAAVWSRCSLHDGN